MADAYPWGNQAPQARLTKLETSLNKSIGARERYMEGHRAKLAEFDEAERVLKVDIRACEAIIEKQRVEAQSNALSKVLQKIAGSGTVDLGALLADPNLESKLAALAAGNAKAPEKKPSKSPSKSDEDDQDNGAGNGTDDKAP